MSLSWPLRSLSALLHNLPRRHPPKGTDASTPPPSLKEFPLFPLLPPEIRQLIFALSLHPRTIELQLRPTPHHRPLLQWASPARPPALLGVSSEARTVALLHYTLAFAPPAEHGRGGIWCDFARDVFVFGRGTWSGVEGGGAAVFAAGDVARIEVLATGMVAVATQELVRFRMGQLPGLRELWLVWGKGWEGRDELCVGGGEVRREALWEGAREGACVYLKAWAGGVTGTMGAREGRGEGGVVLRVARVVEGPEMRKRGWLGGWLKGGRGSG